MDNFKASGLYTKQAHVRVPKDHFEEEHGRKGFFGRVSHLYHTTPPVNWVNIEGPLKPRSIKPIFDFQAPKNTFTSLLYNQDCHLYFAEFNENQKNYFRNADADELFFIHHGSGKLETTYGHLFFKKGDYVVIPRGTTYKFFHDHQTKMLKIESQSEFEQPQRGILGPNALYDQTAIKTPEAQIGSENLSEYVLEIKRLNQITKVTYKHNPLSVVGWKGSLYPFSLSIYDFCPVMSHKYHMPPSAHTTFVAKNFVVCSFVERPLEDSKEGVLKVPFYHSNIDYDEVLFYHQGNFFSRDNIAAGAITFHPQGIHHGPHPKAFKSANDKTHTDEFAVMLDARNPLLQSEWFSKHENQDYWKSWIE